MKSGFWHWIQRFLMAEVLILGLALPLLMTRSAGAEEPIVASDGIDPMVETVALDEVGSQETVELTATDEWRRPRQPVKTSKTIPGKVSTKKCSRSIEKFSIAIFSNPSPRLGILFFLTLSSAVFITFSTISQWSAAW